MPSPFFLPVGFGAWSSFEISLPSLHLLWPYHHQFLVLQEAINCASFFSHMTMTNQPTDRPEDRMGKIHIFLLTLRQMYTKFKKRAELNNNNHNKWWRPAVKNCWSYPASFPIRIRITGSAALRKSSSWFFIIYPKPPSISTINASLT